MKKKVKEDESSTDESSTEISVEGMPSATGLPDTSLLDGALNEPVLHTEGGIDL